MNKTLAIAVAALMFVAVIPGVDAETKTTYYNVPSGATGNFGLAITWSVLGPGWDSNWWCLEDDDPDLDNACEENIDPVTEEAFPVARDLVLGPDGFNIGVGSGSIMADTDSYTEFHGSITDVLPAQTYFFFCIITDYQDGREDVDGGDNWCGEDPTSDVPDDIDDPRGAGCGSVILSSTVPAGGPTNSPTAFVYATFVDETTGNVCIGSTGTFTVTFA